MIRRAVVGSEGVDLVARAGGGETMNQQGSNWNVPNTSPTLRIVIVPFFGWALLYDGGGDVGARWLA